MAILTRRRLAAVLLALGLLLPATANGANPREAEVKAGVLYNLSKFVEWPGDAFGRSSDIVICLSGGNPLGQVAGELAGRRVSERAIRVTLLDAHDDPRGCHVLFMTADSEREVIAVLKRVGKAPVLTISEAATFTALGGVVRLYHEGGRVRFEINLSPVERSGLRISSRVLALARVVRNPTLQGRDVSLTVDTWLPRPPRQRTWIAAPNHVTGVW